MFSPGLWRPLFAKLIVVAVAATSNSPAYFAVSQHLMLSGSIEERYVTTDLAHAFEALHLIEEQQERFFREKEKEAEIRFRGHMRELALDLRGDWGG